MKDHLGQFSPKQIGFLALLEAFGCPLPVDVAVTLCPLPASELINLLDRSEELGWIHWLEQNRIFIDPAIPQRISKKLDGINTSQHIHAVIDDIYSRNLAEKLEPQTLLQFFSRWGYNKDAARVAWDQSTVAIKAGDIAKARRLLKQVVDRSRDGVIERDFQVLVISGTLRLSNLNFLLGMDFKDTEKYLNRAEAIAETMNDRRSQALINLHLGRLFYFSDRRDKALAVLSHGIQEVNKFGDDDILSQSADFIGLYHFMQGRYDEALRNLERCQNSFQANQEDLVINPMTHILLPYSLAYIGRFHQAIGYLKCQLHLAKVRQNKSLAATLRAILGSVLAQIGRNDESIFHLRAAENKARKTNNGFARFLALLGLSLCNFTENRMEQAYDFLNKAYLIVHNLGMMRQFASPFVLEILSGLDSLGFPPITGFSAEEAMERACKGVNTHLRGVALRLRARKQADQKAEMSVIRSDLVTSEEYLKLSGDPVQLAKTRLEMVRLNLQDKNVDRARSLAERVWHDLNDYSEVIFPEDLKHLLESCLVSTKAEDPQKEFFKRYLEATNTLFPIKGEQEVLTSAVSITNTLLKAERGGLFWLNGQVPGQELELRASINLSQIEVTGDEFQSMMRLIMKSFAKNEPIVFHSNVVDTSYSNPSIKAALCIPIDIKGNVLGVLYHDTCYNRDSFDLLDLSVMREMARHISTLISRTFGYHRIRRERDLLAYEKTLLMDPITNDELIAQCPVMLDLLERADRVARSESTVLIIGETGTGKELLAKRIYRMSPRNDNPFVVIDSTSIPKDLFESELFGHEKGAFTGADNQKIGRIEMAHGGTLFFDEIGELPLYAQPKLLRAFEEKCIVRVGGSRNIDADFRLVAATNRRLDKEVAAGRFREDLYYRLNVVPLAIPPLRERKEDITLLAQHFLEHYTRKYGFSSLRFSREDEESLVSYNWPGNVRELKNVIERAVILSSGGRLELNLSPKMASPAVHPFDARPTLNELQREYIKYILEQTGGRISGPHGAAEILAVKRTTLYKRMQKLGISW